MSKNNGGKIEASRDPFNGDEVTFNEVIQSIVDDGDKARYLSSKSTRSFVIVLCDSDACEGCRGLEGAVRTLLTLALGEPFLT